MLYTYMVILLVSVLASLIGTICGIGGGIIIKPLLDSLGIMSIETVNFLSGCMVMSMSGYSLMSSAVRKTLKLKSRLGISISIGAVVGGVIGKKLLLLLKLFFDNEMHIGAVQSFCLFWLTLAMLSYTNKKQNIVTYHMENVPVSILVGLILGLLSSFLGIGGGSFNLVLLSFIFSMQPKEAAQNSIFIIFFAQISNLIFTTVGGNIPDFQFNMLMGMILAGILGAMVGRRVNSAISEVAVVRMFQGLNVVIMLICAFNFYNFIF